LALTLIEAAKTVSGDVVRSAVIQIYGESSEIMGAIPFGDIAGNAYKYNVEQTLPGIAFRGLNEGFPESTGIINPRIETLAIAGGDVDVDKHIIRCMGAGQRAAQTSMKIKALSHNMSDTIINGDSSVNPKAFDGLKVRLTGSQVISNNAAADGGPLSLAKLDQAIAQTDMPTHIIASKAVKLKLTAAARTPAVTGYIVHEKNAMGVPVMFYNGLPILVADASSDLFASIASNEPYTGGGTPDGQSLYVVSFMEGYVQGIQSSTPIVTDLGELDAKPVMRLRIEWDISLAVLHPRAATRLRDIDAALAVVV